MLRVIGALGAIFFGGCVGHIAAGPYLTMRMWVRASHHRAAILEDLHPLIGCAKLLNLLCPYVDHLADVGRLHVRKSQIVAGREADHPRGSAHALKAQQWMIGVMFGCVG